LITSEASLLPLAGIAGLHVASTLQSKPEIPSGPLADLAAEDDNEETADLDNSNGFDPARDASATVGALAAQNNQAVANAGRPALSKLANSDDNNVIELDNTKSGGLFKSKSGADGKDKAGNQPKPDKKLKIPNFFSFRKRLILGGLALLLLIVGWYFAYFVMPKATITIKTDSSDVTSNLDITLDTAAAKTDATKLVLPAQTKQEQKSSTQQVPATGQENRGAKATGQIKLSLADCNENSVTIPAGTGMSTGGLTFITQTSVTLSSVKIAGACHNADFPTISSSTVAVTAQKGGANYNVAPSTFTPAAGGPSVAATSSAAFTGGTDNIVKIVQQADVDAAKQKLTAGLDQNSIKRQLQQSLEDDDLYAITASFNAGTPNVNTNTNVGDEAENVTVTQSVTYTMFGVHKADLSKLIETNASKQIDKNKQSILKDGLDEARISVPEAGSGPQLKLSLSAVSTVGPKLDVEALKQSIVGMKSGQVQDKIKSNVGITDVEVKYSPFWVTKAPKAEKITVVFEKTGGASGTSNDGAENDGQ